MSGCGVVVIREQVSIKGLACSKRTWLAGRTKANQVLYSCVFSSPSSTIRWISDHPSGRLHRGKGLTPYIQVDNLESIYDQIEANGASVGCAGTDRRPVRFAVFQHLEYNILDLVEPFTCTTL
jgi:hypothetical protein